MKNHLFLSALVIGMALSCTSPKEEDVKPPNVLLIYTDDVGYGDISAMGGLIPTPNIDRIFQNGLTFTNAYCTSATCTPSRYSLLTGEYAWRDQGRKVAPGNAPALISEGRETLATIFKKAGYRTSVVGKWHLGLGGPDGPDWNGEIKPGPLEIGFDEAFLIPATGDRIPTVFVKDHQVLNLDPNDPIQVSYSEKVGDWPTGRENPELLTTKLTHGHDMTIVNGISRIGYMTGGKAALWRDEDISDRLVAEAKAFVQKSDSNPFFLYFSTHDIHVPRIANERFQGKSGFGPRGDVLLQLDDAVGQLLSSLEESKKLEETIIIFTSDNGPVWDDGYADQAFELLGDHKAAGPLRGGKYSAFEAGTRVPFGIMGPGIPKQKKSDALFSQVDFLASFASYLEVQRDTLSSPDSQDHWNTLVGKSEEGRDHIVQGAVRGVRTYISEDGYKYIPASEGPKVFNHVSIESGMAPEDQLFDLNNDIGETKNLASEKPEKLQELKAALEKVVNKQQ